MNIVGGLIFLVVLGAVLIFIVRLQKKKNAKPQAAKEELQNSTELLRQELERSGQQIVERMGGHVEELEHLLQEANDKISSLHGELAQSQVAQRNLGAQLKEAQQMIDLLQHEQRQAKEVQGNLQMQGAVVANVVRSAQTVAAVEPVAPEREEAPILQGKEEEKAEAFSIEPSIARAVRNANRREIPEELLADGTALREQVRSLLIAGWSVEAVSRETGLGCSAIELMKKMLHTQVEEDLQGA